MKAEIIWGMLKAVDGETLTIYSETNNPEGESLIYTSKGLDITEEWFKYWSIRRAGFTVIDGVVKEVSEG